MSRPDDFREYERVTPLEALAAELASARRTLARYEEYAARLADPADPLTVRAGAFAEVAVRHARNLRQLCGTTAATLEVLERKGLNLPEVELDLVPALAEDAEQLLEVVGALAFLDADPAATVTKRDGATSESDGLGAADRYAAILAAKAEAGTRHLRYARRVHLRALRACPRTSRLRPVVRAGECSRPRARRQLARLMASASTDDPSPLRRQGARLGDSMPTARLLPESERASTLP